MYQDHFGLHADPFALSPSLRFLYRSQAHAETMAHLGYGLEQGEDIIMISGAIGTGKTLALQNLQAKVSRLFTQVLVNVTRVSYREFLKLVLAEMDAPYSSGDDVGDLLILMKKQALAVHADGRKVLLIVDEAQNLDVETLEGVRMLTNLGQPDKQLFQIVLAGQPGLEELVNRPELAQLRQRIRVHYRLEPLTARETTEYINHRTSVAGGLRPLFTAAAIRRIHELSGGIPRLVNHLASHAMLAAFVDRDREVDARHVGAEGLPETPRPTAGDAAPDPGRSTAPEPATAAAPATPPASDRGSRSGPAPGGPIIADDEPVTAPRMTAGDPRSMERRAGRRPLLWGTGLVVVAALVIGWLLVGQGVLTLPQLTSSAATGAGEPAEQTSPVTARQELAADPLAAGESTGDPADVMQDPPPPDAGDTPGSGGTINQVTPVESRPMVPQTQHWLHVASFRTEARANRLRSQLSAAGAQAVERPVTLADGSSWVRVMVGPFAAADEAEVMAATLRRQGLITFHRPVVE